LVRLQPYFQPLGNNTKHQHHDISTLSTTA
jgi:hypothetical protein